VGARALDRGMTPSDAGVLVPLRRDTRRRLLAPVEINGQGPFHLVVNTGASGCAVTERVAKRLKLPIDDGLTVLVHGVTASTRVRSLRIESLSVGGKSIRAATLPIVADEGDGAEGYLSLSALTRERVLLEITRNRLILSARSPPEVIVNAVSVRIKPLAGHLAAFDTRVQGTTVTTILDTGSDTTIGNLSLVSALGGHQAARTNAPWRAGASAQRNPGVQRPLPPINIGSLRVVGVQAFCEDFPLFEYLKLSNEPAMLLAMDALNQFDGLLIDYENQMIQFRPRAAGRAGRW
jgi:predicted aspartyl protease